MAEFLIKAIDATHPDPVKDKRGCYKRGDIVVVMPDGHEWGRLELMTEADSIRLDVERNLFVVKIPGLDHEVIKKEYGRPEYDYSIVSELRVLMKRKYRVQLDKLPLSTKRELSETGKTSMNWDLARNYIENKALRITE